MQCPNCSVELEPGTGTCPECGTHFETDPTVAYVPLPGNQHPAMTPDQAAAVEGITGFALIVERGPQAGMTFVLPPGKTTVGRNPESDIFLDDITVSRHHCTFDWEHDELSLEDAGSTNGTYVNGSRVDSAVLNPGDEVLVGRFHLVVAHGDA